MAAADVHLAGLDAASTCIDLENEQLAPLSYDKAGGWSVWENGLIQTYALVSNIVKNSDYDDIQCLNIIV